MGERELIKWPDMHERGIALCYLGSINVLCNLLMVARRFAKPPYRLLIQALEGIFHREGRADDCEHDMVACWEWVVSTSSREHTAVRAPELADVAEVRVTGREMIALEVRLRLIAPYDVPLGICIERIHLGTLVVRNAGSLSRVMAALGSGAEEKPGWTAMKDENDSPCEREQ